MDIFELHKSEGIEFTVLEALDIHHTNNNGAEERERLGLYGSAFDDWLIKNNFPEGYQTLCANCNHLVEIIRLEACSKGPNDVGYEESEHARKWHDEAKLRAVIHYSTGTMMCADPYNIHSSPFLDIKLLTGDHILGGGRKHMKQQNVTGVLIWLDRQFRETGIWPDGFQILCWNCQSIKRIRNKEHRKL